MSLTRYTSLRSKTMMPTPGCAGAYRRSCVHPASSNAWPQKPLRERSAASRWQMLLHAQDASRHCTPGPHVAGMSLLQGEKPDWPYVSWQ